MRPKRIVLVRHGESEGNCNKDIYVTKPDFALNLTDKGCLQADECGQRLKEMFGDEQVWFYRSPFYRTRQTHERIAKLFPGSKLYEDPRLREQEWAGGLAPRRGPEVEQARDDYGHFYFRFHGGESCADVFDRVSDFLSTLYRDFSKPEFPPNCVVVSHGMTNRVFLMRLLHYTVEEFEFLRNPKNCGVYVLERGQDDKFKLIGEPERYPERNCKY